MRKTNKKRWMIGFVVLSLCLTGCQMSLQSSQSVEDKVAQNLVEKGIAPEGETNSKQQDIIEESAVETDLEEAGIEENGALAEKEEFEYVQFEYQLPSDENTDTTTEDEEVSEERKLQLVFLGDSIFDHARDGSGVPYLTGEGCNANIYNLAIGGTTAALLVDETTDLEQWNSASVLGVAKAIAGEVSPDAFRMYHAREVFDTCDFSKTDYFIVECGTNDFLSKIPISLDQGGTYDWYTYYGAVSQIISTLQNAYPKAKVIFCSPHYERFYGIEHSWLGDVNSLDLGYGPMINYIMAGCNAAQEAGAYTINNYYKLEIDGYSAADYLLDGIHLSEAGRKLYADMLSTYILNREMEAGN